MKKLLKLIQSFLKVGIIGFGGGSALIPIIEKEVVEDKKLLPEAEYKNHVIVANITPGTLPVKLAAAAGLSISGIPGMLLSALAIAVPGTLLTVILVSVLSGLEGSVLLQIEYLAVGIAVFIIFLLVMYIRKVMKGCREEGTFRSSVLIMLGVFLLTCGKEIRNVTGIEGTPIFDISTINILLLSFFIIFFTCGKFNKANGFLTVIVSTVFLLCTGKSQFISSPAVLYIAETVMAVLAVWGIIKSVRGNKNRSGSLSAKPSIKGLVKNEGALSIMLVLLCLPAVLAYSGVFSYLGNGFVSSIISFGGGEAYLSIADGMFVSSGVVPADIFYGQLLPVANALPGPILSKLLAGIGYYYGLDITGSVAVGYLFALAGLAVSVTATCSVFFVVFHIYRCCEELEIFQVLKKNVLPIICGLLLSTIVTMLYEIIKTGHGYGWPIGGSLLLAAIIYVLVNFLHRRFRLHDVLLILLSGIFSLAAFNVF